LQIKKNRETKSRSFQNSLGHSFWKPVKRLNEDAVDICLTNSCEAPLGLGWAAGGEDAGRAGRASFATSCEEEAQLQDTLPLLLLAQSVGQFGT